jgi:DNA (cytosine-5)-methyltransferase 1
LDDDPRNHLVRQFIKVIEIVRPKYLLMENVKGLLWFSKGQVLAEIKEAFTELGYNVEHQVMKAVEFGVPQKRERVFVLGTLEDKTIEFPKPIFSDRESDLPQPITVDEALSDLPALEIGGGTYESTPYNSNQPSAYQKFMRGVITFEQFLEERNNTPWYLDSIHNRN